MRWEIYDKDRVLLHSGDDAEQIAKAMGDLVRRGHGMEDVYLIEKADGEEDAPIPWADIQPRGILDVQAKDVDFLNEFFRNLCQLADDMPAGDPYTARLDDLLDAMFTELSPEPALAGGHA